MGTPACRHYSPALSNCRLRHPRPLLPITFHVNLCSLHSNPSCPRTPSRRAHHVALIAPAHDASHSSLHGLPLNVKAYVQNATREALLGRSKAADPAGESSCWQWTAADQTPGTSRLRPLVHGEAVRMRRGPQPVAWCWVSQDNSFCRTQGCLPELKRDCYRGSTPHTNAGDSPYMKYPSKRERKTAECH